MLKGQKKKDAYAELTLAIKEDDLKLRPRRLKSAFNKVSELLTQDETNQVSNALIKKYSTYIAVESDLSNKAYIHPDKLEQEPLQNIAVTFYYLGKMREKANLDNLPAMENLLDKIPDMKGKSMMALDKMAIGLHSAAKEMMDALDGAPLDEHGHKKVSHNKKKHKKPPSPKA